MSYGFSDGTNDACVAAGAIDNAASSLTAGSIRDDSAVCILSTTTPTTVIARAEVTSFNAGNFILNWLVAGTAAEIIHYMVVGGSDITNVKVQHSSMGATATGNFGYTGVGFQGDFISLLGTKNVTLNTQDTTWHLSMGAAASSSAQWQTGSHSEDASGTATTGTTYSTVDVVQVLRGTSTAVDGCARFVSFDTDGYTLNWIDIPNSASQRLAALVVKGGVWSVGNGTAPSTATSQTMTTAANTDPKAVMMFSHGGTTTPGEVAATTQSRFNIGGADNSLHEGAISVHDTDGATNMINTRYSSDTKIIRAHTAAATASSSTLLAEADISDMSTSGQFSINWTTTLNGMRYGWFAASQGVEMFTVSETSIHKYDLRQNITSTNIHKYDLAHYLAQTLIAKYDILNVVAASTSVHKYDLLHNILESSIHKYQLFQNILSDSIHKYDLRQYIPQTSVHKYDLLQYLVSSSIHKYDLLHNLVQTSIHKYDILSLLYVTQTSIHKYNLAAYLVSTNTHKYDILNILAQSTIHKYDLLQNLAQSTIHKYDLLNTVAADSIHKYNLLHNVLQTAIHKYDLLHNVLQTSIHKFDTIARVLSQSIHKYDIIQIGTVIATSIHPYNIAQFVAASTSVQKYHLLNFVAITTSLHKYDILNTILQSSIHKYDILQNVIQNSIHKYDVLQNMVQSTIHKYDFLQYLISSSIHKYDLSGIPMVLAQTIHKYDLLQYVTQTSIHKYKLERLVALVPILAEMDFGATPARTNKGITIRCFTPELRVEEQGMGNVDKLDERVIIEVAMRAPPAEGERLGREPLRLIAIEKYLVELIKVNRTALHDQGVQYMDVVGAETFPTVEGGEEYQQVWYKLHLTVRLRYWMRVTEPM